jgi:hypothetical protein
MIILVSEVFRRLEESYLAYREAKALEPETAVFRDSVVEAGMQSRMVAMRLRSSDAAAVVGRTLRAMSLPATVRDVEVSSIANWAVITAIALLFARELLSVRSESGPWTLG